MILSLMNKRLLKPDISILPPTAQVGDSGTGTSWIYNDGRISDSNWFLEASRRGGAWLTSESTVYDGDTLLGYTYTAVKINELGERAILLSCIYN